MKRTGIEVSRDYYEHVVRPLVLDRWPALPHAAARLGSGSDVLGLDDARSRDHDWGLRLNLLVPADLAPAIDAHLEARLPAEVDGLPVRFATTWDPTVRHRVQVEDARTFARSRLGRDPTVELSVEDWLALTGQAVLEVVGGPVFADTAGELSTIRGRLRWYPDDLWRHVVATDWARLAQELPFVGRTGERGDDLGSRLVTARLVGVLVHLGFLLERRWTPYAKWVGAAFAALPRAGALAPDLRLALTAEDWPTRETALVRAVHELNAIQRQVGLPTVEEPTEPFWDRPFRGIRESAITVLEDSVLDPQVRALARGVGSAEQWSSSVDVLTHASRRLRSPDGSDPGA